MDSITLLSIAEHTPDGSGWDDPIAVFQDAATAEYVMNAIKVQYDTLYRALDQFSALLQQAQEYRRNGHLAQSQELYSAYAKQHTLRAKAFQAFLDNLNINFHLKLFQV